MRWLFVICFSAMLSTILIAGAQEPQQPSSRPKSSPIPDRFVNLQVLPKNIKKPQLMGIMKQFCITFNVRCLHCHAVSDDLMTGSFDVDEKDTKQKSPSAAEADL